MRSIGHLPNEKDATILSDALLARGIENDRELEDDGTVSIWVHDETLIPAAKSMLAAYRSNPNAGEFASAAQRADRVRAEQERIERERVSNVMTAERVQYERSFQAFAWVPVVLILASIAVAVQSGILLDGKPDNFDWLRWLFIAWNALFLPDGSPNLLEEIRAGQIWRLFTPMLIHFGLLHLIFNMMWLKDLGSFIQNRFSATYLILLILGVAATSNLAQYLHHGAMFGGMSGVNYGLFGFLWMRGKYDRFAGWQLNPVIVQTMMVWFFLCYTGLLGNVANTAHLVGLLAGGGWGFASAKLAEKRRRW